MEDHLSSYKKNAQRIVEGLKEDLKTIRTGRANPSLVEDIIVDAYGGSTKLKLLELASIFTEGSSAISITPFDPSTVPDIERSIQKSPLGLSPSNQSGRIIVKIPPLSQEQREQYIRLAGQKVEEHRNMVRNARDDVRKKIKHEHDAKALSDDQKFRLEKDVDNATTSIMDDIQKIKENKEKEILEV